MLNPFIQIIQALNAANVRYVIVGGFAVVVHGVQRFTADLDLVVDLSPAEARKAIDLFLKLGFQSRSPVNPYDFAEPSTRHRWVTEKNMTVFSMFDPNHPQLVVDLFVESPIPFEELHGRSTDVNIGPVKGRVCSVGDLIQMKTISGRPLDLQDISDLRQIYPTTD